MENYRRFFDETAARQSWERDPRLRAEFGGRVEVWLSYAKAKAEGRVRHWPEINPA